MTDNEAHIISALRAASLPCRTRATEFISAASTWPADFEISRGQKGYLLLLGWQYRKQLSALANSIVRDEIIRDSKVMYGWSLSNELGTLVRKAILFGEAHATR